MIILMDEKRKKLSIITNNISPITYDDNTVKRKLLDGSYHIQTIGKAAKTISMNVFSKVDQINRINKMQAEGVKFVLLDGKKEYVAYLDKVLNWKIEVKGDDPIYSAAGTFLIS